MHCKKRFSNNIYTQQHIKRVYAHSSSLFSLPPAARTHQKKKLSMGDGAIIAVIIVLFWLFLFFTTFLFCLLCVVVLNLYIIIYEGARKTYDYNNVAGFAMWCRINWWEGKGKTSLSFFFRIKTFFSL